MFSKFYTNWNVENADNIIFFDFQHKVEPNQIQFSNHHIIIWFYKRNNHICVINDSKILFRIIYWLIISERNEWTSLFWLFFCSTYWIFIIFINPFDSRSTLFCDKNDDDDNDIMGYRKGMALILNNNPLKLRMTHNIIMSFSTFCIFNKVYNFS